MIKSSFVNFFRYFALKETQQKKIKTKIHVFPFHSSNMAVIRLIFWEKCFTSVSFQTANSSFYSPLGASVIPLCNNKFFNFCITKYQFQFSEKSNTSAIVPLAVRYSLCLMPVRYTEVFFVFLSEACAFEYQDII